MALRVRLTGAGAGIGERPHGMALLEARDLWVTPPGARDPVVRGISLDIDRGEWVALAGPNGGGKTSLLLALAGLWPPSRGELVLDGSPLAATPRTRATTGLKHVAAVLQDPSSQLLTSTVAEELAFSARNLGIGEEAIESSTARWIEAFGLEADLGRDPRTLSAGRQQLVLLAAALASGPRLLCADEPTAHLDSEARGRVRALIADEVARGLTVVWATQNREELLAASRVIDLGPGRGGGGEPVPATGQERSRQREPGTSVRLRIDPSSATDGPRIVVKGPREILIGRRGVTALLGPNATGKSVVLGALAGLGIPDQMTIEWEVTTEPPPIMALQYPELQVFEEEVADEMTFAAISRGVARGKALDDARHGLIALGIEPAAMLERRTWTLSTGEKRLIEVVGALIAPACLVLLDEPTAGLDAGRKEGLGRLTCRRAEGGPVMIATQDRDWASSLGAIAEGLGA